MPTATNGHRRAVQHEQVPHRVWRGPDETHVDTAVAAGVESPEVADLQNQVAKREAAAPLHDRLAELDQADRAEEVLSDQERGAQRKVAEKVRGAQLRERRRAGLARVRDARRSRLRGKWNARAEAARDRILDPARAVGADHRRWVASTTVLFALLAGGVAWLSATVHDGLVGVGGSWLGYAVEPMASVLLVVSLLAQHTTRQRGLPVPRGFLAFDVGLLAASLLLNTVPYALRYGADPAVLVGHLLAPVLLVAVVVGMHLISHAYSSTITRHRPSERETAAAALLAAAVRSGELDQDTSASAATRWLRETWPGGIGQAEARHIVRTTLNR